MSIFVCVGNGTLTGLVSYFLCILNVYVIPLIFAVAFIVFIWHIYRTFIEGGAGKVEKEGKDLLIYGLVGFFVMFSLWGIVNLLINTFGFGGAQRPPLPTFGTPPSAQSTQNPVFGPANGPANNNNTSPPAQQPTQSPAQSNQGDTLLDNFPLTDT